MGPIGGLAALLARAGVHGRPAIALACDLPFVSAALIAHLAAHSSDALAVAPRPDGIWQPLCARYAPGALAVTERVIASGRRALHAVLDDLGPQAVELPLAPGERGLLADWDEPGDVRRRE
jgi:molybdopterin-guanine dinucleotide biosynthesis protein A